MPWLVLDATGTTIKYKEHFWDKLLSNVCQLLIEGIHALSTCISTLISQCKFLHPQTREILMIMVLQYAVQYHEVHDWVWLQDQSQLTYQALLSHCQLFKSHCEQYQKDKETAQANLTFITTATPMASFIHTNAISTFHWFAKWGYYHPPNNFQLRDKSATPVAATTITPPYTVAKDT